MLQFLYYNYFVIYYLENLLLPKITFFSFIITTIFFIFHYLSFLKSFVAILPNFVFFSFRMAWSSKTFSNFYLLFIKALSLFQHRLFIWNHLKWNTTCTKEFFFYCFRLCYGKKDLLISISENFFSYKGNLLLIRTSLLMELIFVQNLYLLSIKPCNICNRHLFWRFSAQ